MSANGASKKGAKAKKAAAEPKTSQSVEGVVYKVRISSYVQHSVSDPPLTQAHVSHSSACMQVSDTRIVIAADASDSSSDDLDLPERCRVVKLANSVTYDRYVAIHIIPGLSSS